jgi:hypothetical protein
MGQSAKLTKFNKDLNSLSPEINTFTKLQFKLNEPKRLERKVVINNKSKDFKDEFRLRKKYDRTALGGLFKVSIIDIEYLKESEVRKVILNKLQFEQINNKKYDLVGYVVMEYYMKKPIRIDGKIVSVEIVKRFFRSSARVITSSQMIISYTANIIAEFKKDLETAKDTSETVFDRFYELKISTSRRTKMLGKSYIKLPDNIQIKRACVNIKNKDNRCFLYSLLAYKHYDNIKHKDKNEPKYYDKYINEIIEPENFKYPVKLEDVNQFEKLNKLKINIYYLDDDNKLQVLYNDLNRNKNVVNLLFIENENKTNSHYVWIRNLSRLCHSDTCHYTKYICTQCLSVSYPSKEKLEHHLKICMQNMPCHSVMPIEGKNDIMKFKNDNHTFKHPFNLIADFESTLEKVDIKNGNTTKYQKHVANSYGLKYNCIHEEHSEDIKIFNSNDPELVSKNFIEDVERLALKSYELLQLNKDSKCIKWTDELVKNHRKCNNCTECKCDFTEENKKVAHHDHISGEFISTLCSSCNLKYKYKTFIPVYLHNLKGYDSHLFVSSLVVYGYKPDNTDHITCIPNTEEKYISFSKMIKVAERYDRKTKKMVNIMFEIRFLDTIGFMASSIESLSNNLKKECQSIDDLRKVFVNTSNHFTNDDEFKLMTEKGIYPYDYISNFDKLNDKKLPSIKDFYSQLNKKDCSINDYNQAIKVWDTFRCKTLLEYHNIYLKCDVLLLADIWFNFRKVCIKNYKLDPEYYYTAPSLSFDAMLKLSKIELELITDNDMYLFVESGIRGGISQISKRHGVANNKYMKNYDKSKEDSYIVYLDANNLYGSAMCEYLPYANFKWNNDEWNTEKILELNDKADTGYLFSVDLDIPNELHDHFNNYPPCAENISILKENLSEWQQEEYEETKITKLCLTLQNKKDYVVNYRYLKLVLNMGVKLIKVNKVLQFSQKPFLKTYIMKNTELRTLSKNEFEKDFYKLMNNSVYGKTMENVRNRINFRLISTEEEALRVKNMKSSTIFNDNLVGVHIQKTEVKLCKPIYLGQTILDDSKHLMYDFHYNFMLNNIKRENIDLLFTDTDSLCYHVRNEDVFELMKNNKDKFDLSNYPKNHDMYDSTNNKVIGKFKNESVDQITEFIGLRSKLYSFTTDKDDVSHNKCKGVKTSVAKKELSIHDYRHTLETLESKSVEQSNIRSYGHELYTEKQYKVALSARDDKVYISKNYINTYNFGFKGTRKYI